MCPPFRPFSIIPSLSTSDPASPRRVSTFYCRGLIRHGWFRYLSDSLSSLPKSGPNSSLLGPHAHVLEPAAPCIVVFQHFGPLRDLASQ
ncbi:hypothetical protein BCR44DRAFT_1439820, partial [Catenaria anguillulae PL171]